ncbi:hypothetical protein F4Y43_20910, partial [Candidatus Poribacteria bacterium]|nr:hypothetical protein [Candidatus Poribacteria bacterium]
MKIDRYLPIVILICIGFAFATADAQENLAQEVSAIFQQSCLKCHGPSGSFKEALLIDRTALIESQVVIPGDPENSEFYKRLLGPTENGPQMPLNLPPLSPEAVETIARWIAVGAPDWNVQHDINFITTDAILDAIRTHLKSLDPFDRPSARYFTMTHLYNAGETPETLSGYRIALSKLINSLSWKFEITNPTAIDEAQTIFHIDLRRYEWNTTTDVWPQIEQAYPYNIAFDPETQAGLLEKLTQLQTETGSTVPFVHVDWFLATASLPPLYHDILDLPQTDSILETQLRVDVANNIRNVPGIDVWRAGFNDSGVSRHNRVVERHTSHYGAYWKSYDFAGSAESQNIFTHPLDFTHDGGEIIFNLPNGLQAYLLVDANGNRLNEAPIEIVSNPAASDPTVRNGLSCIGCHTQGMKTFTDSVRAAIKQDENPPYNKEHALRLYPEQSVLDALVAKDTERFQQALEKIGGPFADDASRQRFFKQHENEPIQRFHEAFQAPLDASDAAAAVGLETEAFLTQIREKQSLKNLGLQTLTDVNGTVKRDAWTSNFDRMIAALNSTDSTTPSVVQRPERIPGAGVYIPDPNLRAAIAEALGKPPGSAITVAEMATLEELYASGMDISDLTGLEFATNLFVLNINDNLMPDLSPLAGLTQLGGLRIAGNKISDISPLAELKNLGSLEIYDNEISDISPLAGLNLSWLSMYNNPVSDLSPLANLKNLRGMRVSVKEPGDLSPIAELTNLENLFYWGEGDPVPDLSPLTNLPKLRFIDIRGSGKPDLSPLARVDTLERFEFWGSGETIPDLSPLAESINLRELWVINCGITDLTFLENFTSLERLNLERNNISDVSPLAGLTNLKWLKLTHNPIIDFSPLAVLSQTTNILTGEVAIPDRNLRAAIAEALGKENAAFVSITLKEMATLTRLDAQSKGIRDLTGLEFAINLENLHAPDNQVTDLSPLSELINLKYLDIYNNPIESLTPIAGLSNLELITLIGDHLSDLSPLAGLVNLRHFLTWGNPIADLSPLAGLTQLEFLDICGSEASDISPLAKLTGLKELYLVQNRISDVSPLSGLTSLTRLSLGRNNISDVSPLAGLTHLKWLGLHRNSISDFSPLAELPETTTISRAFNPGVPTGGPKIEGPWSWVTVPGERLDSNTDLLAEASAGTITERQVATDGVIQGTSVGNNRWTQGKIALSRSDKNIADMLDEIGSKANTDNTNRIIYGSVILDSPREQDTNLFFGCGGRIKIWHNGALIYQSLAWRSRGQVWDYLDFLPVTLTQGANVLLVAIDDGVGWWSAFFGFEEGTEYAVSTVSTKARAGYALSKSAIHVDDTFTLDLNAEEVTDLAGWQFDIVFDPAVLEAVEVKEGDFLKTDGGATFFQGGTIENTTGKVTGLSTARISERGVSGEGTLLSVTFMAKADGETQITLENFEFGAISGDVIPSAPPEIIITVGGLPPWDVNQDGRVSVLDIILVAKDLGADTPANPRTDVNRDGIINIQDLLIVAQHLGESTDAAAPSAIAIKDLDLLDPATIQAWITQAQIENDGSIAFQQGIATLERLLTLFIPEETALLHNYPNPFNPETWI